MIWSPRKKVVILGELTCPAGEGIQNATNRKQERYVDIQELIRRNGWTPHLFTFEVGARGLVAKSKLPFLRTIGFSCRSTSRIAKDLSLIAAKHSYAIYLAHESKHWDSKRELLKLDKLEANP